ncbi:FimD/PapC C-terminal domain-containing protein [Trinickia mobilis]|uniref:FimD/PapC C-terminal domain-containing protein n=1 Tax=Trinickia mobilis TaxID=2816356 RepID=UPI001A90294B|nr:FimD/PapC C-terminal domain-containing protein [Trinickia mobilis]
MMTLRNAEGKAVPFGAIIQDEDGSEVGVVGPEGQAYAAGLPEKGTLAVKWGSNVEQTCHVHFDMSIASEIAGYRMLDGMCSQ